MSSPDQAKDSAAPVAAVILPKIHELRRLVDAARWGLLDVIIWANEIEDDILKGSNPTRRAALDDFDFSDLTANRVDSEAREYQPDDQPDW